MRYQANGNYVKNLIHLFFSDLARHFLDGHNFPLRQPLSFVHSALSTLSQLIPKVQIRKVNLLRFTWN